MSGLMKKQPLALEQTLRLAVRMAEILGDVHQRNIMHKNVAPSNIIWNRKTGEIRLIDFGMATELIRETEGFKSERGIQGTLTCISRSRRAE